MNAIQVAVPSYSGEKTKHDFIIESRSSTIPILACVLGLLLLGSCAQDVDVIPKSEMMPFNDTVTDLTLPEIVARIESHFGLSHKEDAYQLGKLLLDLSDRHQISPSLILAVIEKESSFRPAVVSKAGAIGLMQLLPDTAAQIASLYHVRGYHSVADLANPSVNLRLGVAYLAHLRRQFGQSLHYLAAYNLGPTALRHRLKKGIYELGSIDPYVRTIHERARSIRGKRRGHGSKNHRHARAEAMLESTR
jgi:hypothetical protein